jgi:hypothetical protein
MFSASLSIRTFAFTNETDFSVKIIHEQPRVSSVFFSSHHRSMDLLDGVPSLAPNVLHGLLEDLVESQLQDLAPRKPKYFYPFFD